jgi:glycosyltransferase involved in cell wall biosynthesis
VARIETELERADLVAVPIRFGGGTRIKILESFAHRIPVVSTSLGAYGLGVIDRRHLLLADEVDTFATASLELLTQPALRTSIVGEAQRLFRERFRWTTISETVKQLAIEVAGRGARHGDGASAGP